MKIPPKHSHFLIWPFLCLMIGAILFFWLNNRTHVYFVSGSTMGTYYRLTWVTTRSAFEKTSVVSEVEQRLDKINRLMSTYWKESEISRFNQFHSIDWFKISSETALVVKEALSIAKLSGGAFDISVGPLVDLWGFGPRDQVLKVPRKAELEGLKPFVGYEKIVLKEKPNFLKKSHPKMRIDLSGIAKGYGVDVLADYLSSIGIRNYLVDIGGELKAHGTRQGKKWRIAIELPKSDSLKVQKMVPLYNQAMATSGDYRNYFEKEGKRYSHMIDPRTGRPIEHYLASVTVIDSSCMKADGLATALMVLGLDKGYELALKNGWAVQFLTRANKGFKEKTTPKFDELTK